GHSISPYLSQNTKNLIAALHSTPRTPAILEQTLREVKDASDPSKSYTTTWFDSWRSLDGKADEHRDPATKPD
ncbi:hypothetical protein J5279_18705, partial [Rhizobium sp. B209b/85]|nr:hypothetical protein [Rhizobium sp. B209b/85]